VFPPTTGERTPALPQADRRHRSAPRDDTGPSAGFACRTVRTAYPYRPPGHRRFRPTGRRRNALAGQGPGRGCLVRAGPRPSARTT